MSRTEEDSLGSLEVPDNAYYGIQTARAVRNFPVSGITESPLFISAYVTGKKAAALANMELGVLDQSRGGAIVRAADEVLAGGFGDQFPVDVFQAGAGTSFNMNVNEVLANRALEILGRKRGEYSYLSPNDHVNLGQSTNDTFPTASHIAVIFAADRLLPALDMLMQSFFRKAGEFAGIPKLGRTHLMDAVPLTLGNVFHAYGTAAGRAAERIRARRYDLLELPIGGTAVGTGANSHPRYREIVIRHIGELTGLPVIQTPDSFASLQSRIELAAFSGSLRELALELIRIANDLRLLYSGPYAGLAEIILPAVQPGSSIMAGKVNPVMAECLDMVAFQVVGNDTTVALAAQAGQLELNVMTPVITHNLLSSLEILSNYLPAFTEQCVNGIAADEVRCRAYIEGNPMLATFLIPRIGYAKTAELVKDAQRLRIPVRELAISRGIVTGEEAESIFDPIRISRTVFE
jgi:aspartate ammonia-lyase